MGKRRNLNGLPNSLVERYFSTLFYLDKGYMSDWIWNAANEKNIIDIEIDIINETVSPAELQIRPITIQLQELRETIDKTLIKQRFDADFITEAKFIIFISQRQKVLKLFTCQAILKDIEGRVYAGKVYTERAYTHFKVFDFHRTFFEKLKQLFN